MRARCCLRRASLRRSTSSGATRSSSEGSSESAAKFFRSKMPEAPLLRGVSSGEPEGCRRSSCQWRMGRHHDQGHLGTLLTLFLETYLVSLPA